MGKILFIRGGAVGDFILTMPSIRLVRETLPETEIEILGYPAIASLATAARLADRVLADRILADRILADRIRSIEDARLATFFAPGAKLDPDWCAYFAGFDVVISYLYDPDGYFAGNLAVAGVKTLVTCPFRPDESEPHIPAAVQFARPLEQLALFLSDVTLDLDYPGDYPRERLVSDSESGAIIALHPGSGSPKKNWSFESWVQVLQEIHRKAPETRFLITSGEAEESVIGEFLALLNGSTVPYRHLHGFSLPDLAAVYRKVDFYLGHDSGISHLAASAGAPGLLLFGPTCPGIWAPVSSKMKTLQSPDYSLAGIKVSEVLAAISFESYPHALRR
jgi:heptosyltransferase-3